MGSPFASHTQSTVPLPCDPPHTITIRKLTGREIEQAQEAHRSNLGSPRSWAATFRRMLEKGSATDPDVLQAIRDPLTGYDRYALVRAGLVAWSYPQALKFTPSDKVDGKVDAIEDLDDEALDFIATEVLRLTKPQLFMTSAEDAEVEKKTADDPASIVGRERAATV
jgi:hypothetical protein